MYQVLISMPDGKLLVGDSDSDDPAMPHMDGWRLSVRFDGRTGELVVQGSKANLLLDGFAVFDVHNVTGGATCFADYVDGGGRHEYVYRATVDDGAIAIGIALDTNPTNVKDTSWLNHPVSATPKEEREEWSSSSVSPAPFRATPPITQELGRERAIGLGSGALVMFPKYYVCVIGSQNQLVHFCLYENDQDARRALQSWRIVECGYEWVPSEHQPIRYNRSDLKIGMGSVPFDTFHSLSDDEIRAEAKGFLHYEILAAAKEYERQSLLSSDHRRSYYQRKYQYWLKALILVAIVSVAIFLIRKHYG
jgi:hypothetical protein